MAFACLVTISCTSDGLNATSHAHWLNPPVPLIALTHSLKASRSALFCGLSVGAVRTQTPHLGEAEHLRHHSEAAVGLIGDVAQVVVELGNIRPRDPRDRQLPQCRQDEALQVAAIFLPSAGLHANGDVLLVEPLRQFFDRDGLAPGVAFGGGILSVAGSGDDGERFVTGRPVPGLVRGGSGSARVSRLPRWIHEINFSRGWCNRTSGYEKNLFMQPLDLREDEPQLNHRTTAAPVVR